MTDETQETVNPQAEAPKAEQKEDSSPLKGFVKHQLRAAEEMSKAFGALLPPEFRDHSKTAGEEWLTSFKVLVEGTASILEKELDKMTASHTKPENKDGGQSTTGKNKVKVEVL